MKKDYLNATDFFRFITCPHWPWFDRFASAEDQALKREFTEGEKRRMDDGYSHERDVMQSVFHGEHVTELPISGDPEDLFQATVHAMKEGVPYIYQGTLLDGDWQGRPDLLVRVDGASSLGNWHYVPLDIKSSHELKTEHEHQLVFYSVLLKRIQGVFPEKAGIVNGDKEKMWFVPEEMIGDFEKILEKIQRIRKGEKPEPVVRKSCFDSSPWGAACLAFAKTRNDIAMLYNVDVRRLEALRALGIRTVDDAADMDTMSYVGAAPGLTRHGLEAIRMQARSLRDGTVFIRRETHLSESPYEIYFDIESDMPNDADYLYGFWIRNGDAAPHYIQFLAEKPEDEGVMWKEFLAWIPTLPADYVVYHYASFEAMRLRLLEGRHGGSEWLELFRTRMIDLKPMATKNITYPLYFYSLKQICKFLGFSWRGELQSGGASIDYYERWCETGDRKVLQDIIIYNEDDVRATAFLKDWLTKYGGALQEYEKPYPWK